MSDLRVYAKQTNVARATDDSWVALRSLRDGVPIVVPWFQALVLEGRVFQVIGPEAVTTTFTGMTLLALASFGDDDNSLYVDIPDGTAAIPLEVYVNFQATGAAIVHAQAFVSGTLNGTGGTETACTIRNYRLDTPITSGATAAHTADSETDHVTGGEVQLFRYVTAQDLDGVGLEPDRTWKAAQAAIAPVVLDAGSINVIMAPTTSGTGWASISWAEVAESVIQ